MESWPGPLKKETIAFPLRAEKLLLKKVVYKLCHQQGPSPFTMVFVFIMSDQ